MSYADAFWEHALWISDSISGLDFFDSVADIGANSIWQILEARLRIGAVARHKARGYASKILVEDRHGSVGDGRRHAIVRLGNSAGNAGQRVAVSSKRYRVSDCIFEIR